MSIEASDSSFYFIIAFNFIEKIFIQHKIYGNGKLSFLKLLKKVTLKFGGCVNISQNFSKKLRADR